MTEETLKGQLLIAVPRLGDSNFTRTVVLMLEHDEEGALGVVLNRPSNTSIADLWEQVCEEPCDCQLPVNLGGPVAGPLIALHGDSGLSESDILPGVYMATEKETLDQLVRQSQTKFLIFSGYAGWAAGQLESELDAGGWLIRPARDAVVFSRDENLWEAVGQEFTTDLFKSTLNIKHIPDDPSQN